MSSLKTFKKVKEFFRHIQQTIYCRVPSHPSTLPNIYSRMEIVYSYKESIENRIYIPGHLDSKKKRNQLRELAFKISVFLNSDSIDK